MKEEIFKEIAGYEGLYEVSNLGNVRSLKYGKSRVLKPNKDTKGYLQVNLFKEGNRKIHIVHRLVAQAFIDNPDNLPEINHKDECKTNNRVDNIEWCTTKYNANYGTRNQRIAETQRGVYNNPKLSKKAVQLTLDYIFVKEYPSIQECGRNGFGQRQVAACCNNKYCSQGNVYKGYRWMFAKDYYTLLERRSKGKPS